MQPDSLAFLQDMLTQGERLNKLAAEQFVEDPATAERITGIREMIALRNRLAHAYQSTDPRKLWDIARTDIPLLIRETNQLIQEGESEHP